MASRPWQYNPWKWWPPDHWLPWQHQALCLNDQSGLSAHWPEGGNNMIYKKYLGWNYRNIIRVTTNDFPALNWMVLIIATEAASVTSQVPPCGYGTWPSQGPIAWSWFFVMNIIALYMYVGALVCFEFQTMGKNHSTCNSFKCMCIHKMAKGWRPLLKVNAFRKQRICFPKIFNQDNVPATASEFYMEFKWVTELFLCIFLCNSI